MITMLLAAFIASAPAAPSAAQPSQRCAGWNNFGTWGSADIYTGSGLPAAPQERLAPLIWLILADAKHERPGLDKSAWELYLNDDERCGFLEKHAAAVPRHRDMARKLMGDVDAALSAEKLDVKRAKELGQYLINEMSWLSYNGRDVTFANDEAVRGRGPWIVPGAQQRYDQVLASYRLLKARLQAKPRDPAAVKPAAAPKAAAPLEYKDRPQPAGTERDKRTGQDYYK